jgi:hypothetical protein
MKPHRGVLVLVFGILGFVVCPFLSIAAWVMGSTDLDEMAHGRMDPTGRDLTKAGRICGIVGSILLIVPMLMILFMFVGMAIFRN